MARPRKPLLSDDRIVETARALVDAEGLEAVSTRRLAAELGRQRALPLQPLPHQGRDPRRGRRRGQRAGRPVDVRGRRPRLARPRCTTGPSPTGPPCATTRTSSRSSPAGPGRRPAGLRVADAVFGAMVAAGWPPAQATSHRRADAVLRHRLRARLLRPGLRGRRDARTTRPTTRTSARPTCWPSSSRRSTRAPSRRGCGRCWTAWSSSTSRSGRRLGHGDRATRPRTTRSRDATYHGPSWASEIREPRHRPPHPASTP